MHFCFPEASPEKKSRNMHREDKLSNDYIILDTSGDTSIEGEKNTVGMDLLFAFISVTHDINVAFIAPGYLITGLLIIFRT